VTRGTVSNLSMLFVCLLAGRLLRRSGRLADNAHSILKSVILHVSFPALSLRYLHDVRFDSGTL